LLLIIRAAQTLLFDDDGGWTKALAPKEEQPANAMAKEAYNFIVASLFDRYGLGGVDLQGMLWLMGRVDNPTKKDDDDPSTLFIIHSKRAQTYSITFHPTVHGIISFVVIRNFNLDNHVQSFL